MWEDKIRSLNLQDNNEVLRVKEFLNNYNLKLDDDVDYTLVIEEDGNIIATASKGNHVFKCFAIKEELRGEGITSLFISKLLDKLFSEGKYRSFIFTKKENVKAFKAQNYKEIAAGENVCLLENGLYSIYDYLDKIEREYSLNSKEEKGAAIVYNSYIDASTKINIELMSKRWKRVIVFITEHSKRECIIEELKHIKNIDVIGGGNYIIALRDFPSYFLKEEERVKKWELLMKNLINNHFINRFNIKEVSVTSNKV